MPYQWTRNGPMPNIGPTEMAMGVDMRVGQHAGYFKL